MLKEQSSQDLKAFLRYMANQLTHGRIGVIVTGRIASIETFGHKEFGELMKEATGWLFGKVEGALVIRLEQKQLPTFAPK